MTVLGVRAKLGQHVTPRSVVGTIDLPDERALAAGSEALDALFTSSLSRHSVIHEVAPGDDAKRRSPRTKSRGRG
jgi:hypothetical protein